MANKAIKKKRKACKPRAESGQSQGRHSVFEGIGFQVIAMFLTIIAIVITLVTFIAGALLRPLTVHGEQIKQLRKGNEALAVGNMELRVELENVKSRAIRLEIMVELIRERDRLSLVPSQHPVDNSALWNELRVNNRFERIRPGPLDDSSLQCDEGQEPP